MSDCDGMKITIQNYATDMDSKPITAQIQGFLPDSTSTLSGFTINEQIAGNGGSKTGTANSGKGTNGTASGTIQVGVVFDPKVGVEVLNLSYKGTPGNKLGWYGCSPTPTSNGTANFYVTLQGTSGKGGDCQQTFIIRSYTASQKS